MSLFNSTEDGSLSHYMVLFYDTESLVRDDALNVFLTSFSEPDGIAEKTVVRQFRSSFAAFQGDRRWTKFMVLTQQIHQLEKRVII